MKKICFLVGFSLLFGCSSAILAKLPCDYPDKDQVLCFDSTPAKGGGRTVDVDMPGGGGGTICLGRLIGGGYFSVDQDAVREKPQDYVGTHDLTYTVCGNPKGGCDTPISVKVTISLDKDSGKYVAVPSKVRVPLDDPKYASYIPCHD